MEAARAELRQQETELEDRLTDAHVQRKSSTNVGLLDSLPGGKIRVENLPAELARRLFEALRLELHYDEPANVLKCTITLAGPTISAAHEAAEVALQPDSETDQAANTNKNAASCQAGSRAHSSR